MVRCFILVLNICYYHDYALWNAPVKEDCPDCNWPVLTLKSTKRRGPEKVCPQKACKYATPYEGDPEDINGPKELS